MRRARNRTTSSVASSAQWASSITRIVPGALGELILQSREDVLAIAPAQGLGEARSDRGRQVAQQTQGRAASTSHRRTRGGCAFRRAAQRGAPR